MAQSAYQPPSSFALFPPVVKNLLILNVLAFIAQYLDVRDFLEFYGALQPLVAPDQAIINGRLTNIGDFYPWQVITYAFLHGGFGHIFFNLFILWMFGQRIENVWGSRRFALFYFVCVIGAALCQMATVYATGSVAYTLGASGGVYGVLLAFGMTYPDEPIYLYFFIPIKAKYLVVLFGLFELFAGWSGTNSGVAHFAHLGGMLFGLILILYWRGKLPMKPSASIR